MLQKTHRDYRPERYRQIDFGKDNCETAAKHGENRHGTNVGIGYYDQKQAEFHHRTVLEELWHEYRNE